MPASATDAYDFLLSGDPARARDTVANALQARGFAVTWTSEWAGRAERGSKTKQMLLGAFAQHFEVDLSVGSTDAGTLVRVIRGASGFSGGLAGRQRTIKQFRSLTEELGATFGAAGVLLQQGPPQG